MVIVRFDCVKSHVIVKSKKEVFYSNPDFVFSSLESQWVIKILILYFGFYYLDIDYVPNLEKKMFVKLDETRRLKLHSNEKITLTFFTVYKKRL